MVASYWPFRGYEAGLLKVVYVKENDDYVVITVIWEREV